MLRAPVPKGFRFHGLSVAASLRTFTQNRKKINGLFT